MWFVYIIRCNDGTLYTGMTNDIESRIEAHNNGKAAKYTRGRTPVVLIHSETFKTRGEALSRERIIKSFTKEQKERLCKA